jgi:site-specific DNA recombinase
MDKPKRQRASNRKGAVAYIFTHNDTETAAATAQVQGYCKAQGLDLREILVDTGNSGEAAACGLTDRDAGSRIITSLLAEPDRRHLIVIKLDDLGTVQDVRQLMGGMGRRWRYLHVIKSGLTSENKDGTGKLLATLIDDVSHMVEKQLRAMSTRSTLVPLIAGGVPYGWDRVGNRLVINPRQLAVRKKVGELREAGHSLREIAAKLNAAGETTKMGRQWNARAVNDLKYARHAADPDQWKGSHIHDEVWSEHMRRGEILDMIGSTPEGRELLATVERTQRDRAMHREIMSLVEPEESWEERLERQLR